MRRTTLIYLILVLMFSCTNTSTKKHFYKLNNIDEYEISLLNNSNYFCIHPKISINENKNILSFIDPVSRYIYLWDLEDKKILDSIDINYYKYQFVQQYHIIDSNNLILAFNSEYFGLNHDKVLIRTNRNKEILGTFNFKGANVPTSKQCVPDSLLSFSNYESFPMYYDKDEKYILASLSSYYKKNRELQLDDVTQYKLVGKVYEDSCKNFSPFNFHITPPKKGYNNPASFDYTKSFIDTINNIIGLSLGNTDEIQLYDIGIGKLIKSINLESIFVDSHIKALNDTDFYRYENYLPLYSDMVCNNNNNKYYRIVKLPLNDTLAPIFFSFPLFTVIEYCYKDDKQKEAVLPFGYGCPIIAFKNGFLAYNQYKSKKQNTRCFSYFEFDIKRDFEETPNYFMNKLYAENNPKHNKKGWNSYFKSININNDTVVSINLNRICNSCKVKLGKALSNGILNQNLSIVLVADDGTYIDTFVEEYNLEKDNYIIDDENNQSFYIKQYVNPIVIINKDDTVNEIAINPRQMNFLIDTILNY